MGVLGRAAAGRARGARSTSSAERRASTSDGSAAASPGSRTISPPTASAPAASAASCAASQSGATTVSASVLGEQAVPGADRLQAGAGDVHADGAGRAGACAGSGDRVHRELRPALGGGLDRRRGAVGAGVEDDDHLVVLGSACPT